MTTHVHDYYELSTELVSNRPRSILPNLPTTVLISSFFYVDEQLNFVTRRLNRRKILVNFSKMFFVRLGKTRGPLRLHVNSDSRWLNLLSPIWVLEGGRWYYRLWVKDSKCQSMVLLLFLLLAGVYIFIDSLRPESYPFIHVSVYVCVYSNNQNPIRNIVNT